MHNLPQSTFGKHGSYNQRGRIHCLSRRHLSHTVLSTGSLCPRHNLPYEQPVSAVLSAVPRGHVKRSEWQYFRHCDVTDMPIACPTSAGALARTRCEFVYLASTINQHQKKWRSPSGKPLDQMRIFFQCISNQVLSCSRAPPTTI